MSRSHWLGVALAAGGLLGWVAWAAAEPAGLGQVVDPAVTPRDVKPEWYFLGLYHLLQVGPARVGVLLPGLVGAGLVGLPLLHGGAGGRGHRLVQVLTAAGVSAYLILTVLGYLAEPVP